MSKDIEVVVVSYEEYTDYEFIPKGTWFVMSATQDYYFFKTSDRKKAQDKADEIFGVGKYQVKSEKTQKTKSRLESGGYSCYGTATRKGQKSYN